jgi:hypothetical protein
LRKFNAKRHLDHLEPLAVYELRQHRREQDVLSNEYREGARGHVCKVREETYLRQHRREQDVLTKGGDLSEASISWWKSQGMK